MLTTISLCKWVTSLLPDICMQAGPSRFLTAQVIFIRHRHAAKSPEWIEQEAHKSAAMKQVPCGDAYGTHTHTACKCDTESHEQ